MSTGVKVFSVNSTTTTRTNHDGSSGQGDGHSKHLYVGRDGTKDYKSYIKFDLDWSGVGRIISAVLNLTTDEYNTFGPAGEPGIFAAPGVTEQPIVSSIRRCTTAPTFGSNVDGTFDSSDYTKPQTTTAFSKTGVMSPHGPDQLIQIDITDLVRQWAPLSVYGGHNYPNYGIALLGDVSTAHNWSGWSKYHTGGGGAAEQPSITLTYELAPTAPNAPSALDPNSLALPFLSTFEGDFSDVKAGDFLISTDIEIYDNGFAATGTGATNRINRTNHGLANGANIWVTAATGGGGIPSFTKLYVRNKTTNDFQISTTATGAVVDFNDYSAITYSVQLAARNYLATQSDQVAGHFIIPIGALAWTPKAFVTYRWRARSRDQEGQIGPWSSLVSFKLIDTPPNAPTLSPVNGSSYASFNLVLFRGGTFSDPDGGDKLEAHQVQLSPYPQGDLRWDEADGILWDTGKQFDPSGATAWEEPYGGRDLAAGTYYWRAKVWDSKDQESAWSYAQIILTTPFSPDPGNYSNVQVNPHAPWRIVIRDLYLPDGVTKTTGRAPGNIVAVLEEAKNVGASVVYNSPGEIHFTLLKDDPQIAVIEPKQTHYALEFYSGDGWQEKFAGVVWDVDATETDVVFKGIDYLALYDTCIDERYDPLKPNKSYTSNGSFYDNIAIRTIVLDQLNWAKKQTDSWVGFISIGQVDAMNEKVSVYSTFQPTLSFVSGLIDSHRQGTGKRTRMSVVKTTAGTYQLKIVDDPGIIRNDLALYYGELVQGYRVIVFGDGWANVMHVVGRNREGSKVTYRTIKGQPFQPATSLYGRIASVSVMDGITDQNDLQRRGTQAAIQAAKLGKNIAIGLRTEYLSPPLQGYDVADVFPVKILDGAIDTTRFGSGYWSALAVAWEASDVGEQSLIVTVVPREDAASPNPDLLVAKKIISTQPEWQLGWKPPDPLKATSIHWLDQTTGQVYHRTESTGTLVPVTGSP